VIQHHRMATQALPMSINNSTWLLVRVQGALLGIVAIVHGVAEISHGNTAIDTLLVGNIGAFTLIPNYLITGIVNIIVSLSVILCATILIHKQYGSLVFFLLSILLFFVGGGVAEIPFLLLTWGISTRITAPLTWWRTVLPERLRMFLANSWLTMWIIDYVTLGIGIGIWLFVLPPGTPYPPHVMEYIVDWSFLSVGLLGQGLTIVAGFARDSQMN
jgi:hypothetical protein